MKLKTFFIRLVTPLFFLFLYSNNGFAQGSKDSVLLNDSHFHLTNYVQEGTDIHKFLEIMGNKVGRVALFGIPLQQMWNYNNSGNFAPTYYLASDDPLYYYSFTDAFIAMALYGGNPGVKGVIDHTDKFISQQGLPEGIGVKAIQ